MRLIALLNEMFKSKLELIILGMLCFQVIQGTHHGATSGSCSDMIPQHPNTTVSAGPAPYTITAKWSSDVKGAVEVTLSGKTSGDLFQGYMVMAHMEGMEMHKVGKFFATTDGRVLDCDNYGVEMAATHANIQAKDSLKVFWIPDGFKDTVVFRATVARDFETYWTKVDSEPFDPNNTNSGSQNMVMLSLLLAALAALAILRR